MLLNKANLDIAKSASKGNSKYVISGILVDKGKTVVTDGHMMIIVGSPTPVIPTADFPQVEGRTALEDFKPFVIPAGTALEISKALPKKMRLPVLEYAAITKVEENHSTIVTTDLDTERAFRFRRPDGQYPNWRAVLPVVGEGEKPNTPICFGMDVMERTLAQMKSLGVETFTLRIFDKDSAVRVDAVVKDSGQPVTAILMPMRGLQEANNWEEPAIVEVPPVEAATEATPEPAPEVAAEPELEAVGA